MSNNTKADIDAAREYYETHSVEDEIAKSVPGEPITSAMSGYSVRLPTDVLEQARKIAADRGMTTGAWLREAIENAVTAVDQPASSVPVAELLALVAKYDHPSTERSAGRPSRKVTPGTSGIYEKSGYADLIASWASTNHGFPAFSTLVSEGRPFANLLVTPPGLDSASADFVLSSYTKKALEQIKSHLDQEDGEEIVRTKNTVKRVVVQRVTTPRRRGKS